MLVAIQSSLSQKDQAEQTKLDKACHSRFRIVIVALILETLIMIPLLKTFLFIVGIFNLPAILALMMCTIQPAVSNRQMQKKAKLLLKVGIAKAIGGVLLAIYIGLKYAYMLQESGFSSKAAMELCVIYLGGSALVDILYSILAYRAIKQTRTIVRILRKRSVTKKAPTAVYIMTPTLKRPSSETSPSSGSCSEEETSDKDSHNSI